MMEATRSLLMKVTAMETRCLEALVVAAESGDKQRHQGRCVSTHRYSAKPNSQQRRNTRHSTSDATREMGREKGT